MPDPNTDRAGQKDPSDKTSIDKIRKLDTKSRPVDEKSEMDS